MTINEIHQITVPTPYAVGDVHVYIHIGETITMFDAGVKTNEAWDTFVDQLNKLHLNPDDIKQVVLTHHHPDHLGLIDHFDHIERVYGHELIKPWLSRDQDYFNHYLNFFNELYDLWDVPSRYRHIDKTVEDAFKHSANCELTHTLREGDRIPGLPFVVIETPGHAESHLSFLHEKTGQLIGGDFLLKHISSNPLLEPPDIEGKERPKPLLRYRDSMKKILNYPVAKILPGHGEVFINHEQLIHDRLEKQENRAQKVLQFIDGQMLSPFDICKWLFPKHYEKQFGLTMSETIGQLDYLKSVGAIREVVKEGQVMFESTNQINQY